jgi:hypothetical protein
VDEAAILGRYLIGESPEPDACGMFERAAGLRPIPLGERDRAVLAFAYRHPWSIGLLDAALAAVRPDAALRQKLFVMTAILEARPTYCDHFLAVDRPRRYVATIVAVCARAALRRITGLMLLAFLR